MRFPSNPFKIAITIITVTATMLFIAGCLRYGSAEGLLRKVQVEIAHFEPHESLVPTPLPQAVDGAAIQTPTIVSNLSETGPSTADATLLLPTATPTAKPIEESIPTIEKLPAPPPLQPFVELTGLHHEWQTWNNCGPATLSFYLSYYGSQLSQADTGSQLRHNEDDKNVSPLELAEFARNAGYMATVRVNGTSDLMRTFLSNGFPVIIETWLEEEPNDGMGHYRLLTGYDDASAYWIAYDSYITTNLLNPEGTYRGIRLDYGETEALWKAFNRVYVLIYPPERQQQVMDIFGDSLSEPRQSAVAALEQAKAEIAANPQDAYAWFNLGSMLIDFNYPKEAAAAFDEARRLGLPWRMLWYQYAPFAAYYQVGRYQEVVSLADATMRNVQTIEELYYWKGMALAAMGDTQSAKQQLEFALNLNPNFTPAQQAWAQLR